MRSAVLKPMRSVFEQPMKIHELSVEDALRSLRSKPEGLSLRGSFRRLREFGPNRVERIRPRARMAPSIQRIHPLLFGNPLGCRRARVLCRVGATLAKAWRELAMR